MEMLKDEKGEFDGWQIDGREFRKPKALAKFEAWKFDYGSDEKGLTIIWLGSNSPLVWVSTGEKDWVWEKVPNDR